MALLFGVFFIMIMLGIPIAFDIAGASAVYLAVTKMKPLMLVPQRMTIGLDSFPYLAIPLFIWMGFIMEKAGLSKRLVEWVRMLCGRLTGALGSVAIICCAIFAALTGSGPATVAAIGTLLIPAMIEDGYPDHVAAGLVATAGCLGPIIPPSIVMIVYGTTVNLSVSKMFAAGIVPGILIVVLLIAANMIAARKLGVKKDTRKYTAKEALVLTGRALPTLCLPIVILGSIYGGICTATEAATVGVIGALILATAYRQINLKILVSTLKDTVGSSAMVCFLIAVANLFCWILTAAKIPGTIVKWVVPMLGGQVALYWVFLMIILLLIGCLMESLSSILILAPILTPIGLAMGINELHLAMVFCCTLIVGFVTPPFGANLFTAVSITKIPFEKVVKGVLPFLAATGVALLLMILFPGLSTFLPGVFFAG